jgi:hypothetical protein
MSKVHLNRATKKYVLRWLYNRHTERRRVGIFWFLNLSVVKKRHHEMTVIKHAAKEDLPRVDFLRLPPPLHPDAVLAQETVASF